MGPSTSTTAPSVPPLEEVPAVPVATAHAATSAWQHAAMTGTHSHPHASYGGQGDDATHQHSHSHDGSASHDHPHGDELAATKECPTCHGTGKIRGGMTCPTCDGTGKVPAGTDGDPDNDGDSIDGDELAAVGLKASAGPYPLGLCSFVRAATADETALLADGQPAAFDLLGAPCGIRFGSTLTAAGAVVPSFQVVTADGSPWGEPAGNYVEALAEISKMMAADPDSRPILAEGWLADSHYEDTATGDGRFIDKGATEWRDCPWPLMLVTTNEGGGHMGAVLAGFAEAAGMVGTTGVAKGRFHASDAGRQFLDILKAQGRYGVSIDVAEAEVNREASGLADDGEGGGDGNVHFSRIKVMGLSGCMFPAFEHAHATVDPATVAAQTASAAESCEPCALATVEPNLDWRPMTARSFDLDAIAAAGIDLSAPPAEWFDDPKFGRPGDDPRLVRQPQALGGGWACPLTVTPEGRVYGHFYNANTCHTAYGGCLRPPRSYTGYKLFHLRPLAVAGGGAVMVGHVTMGCGHFKDDGTPPVDQVYAHYDGGPGVTVMCHVRAGDDAYGGWFAGSLAEGVSPEQVRKFQRLSVSGHWRRYQGNYEMLACTSVISPGYPVSAEAMAAAGWLADDDLSGLDVAVECEAFLDGVGVALTAAGIVAQPSPFERELSDLESRWERRFAVLEAEVKRATSVAGPLVPEAARLLAAAPEFQRNGHGPPAASGGACGPVPTAGPAKPAGPCPTCGTDGVHADGCPQSGA